MITGILTITEIVCCSCFTHFGMDSNMNQQRLNDGKAFYCPNGHKQWYSESEVDKLKKANQRLKSDNAWYSGRAGRLEKDLEDTKRSRAAIKGQLTKTRKRIVNGVCPCCNRTFGDLAAHITVKHPDFKEVVK